MHTINNNMNYISDSHHHSHHHGSNIYVNNVNEEVLKHIESLRTRLGFAKFKLSNGWENNTLGDVECFWKQKQRQSIKDIPIPRFTQQDIIDKRSYIQASGAKYAKARRYRLLNRSLSNPSTKQDSLNFISSSNNKSPIKKPHRKSLSIQQHQQQHSQQSQYNSNDEDNDSSNSSMVSSASSSHQQNHHHTQQTQEKQNQTYYFHHYDKEAYTKKSASLSPKPTPIHSVSSFDASCVPDDLNGEPSVVKNSLDYLSYAIAMTERNESQEHMDEEEEEEEPTLLEDDVDEDDEDHDINYKEDWTRTSQLRLSLSIPSNSSNNHISSAPSPTPSSPTNAAAQAMLMFVNRDPSSSSSA